ncbi:MAG: replication-associated recombination protein A [Clostridia bacterium]|nr:replication-associated recombination protein A [Clostridia bacterium]
MPDLSKPLAYRMSPKTLEDYVGQEHILGKGKILYRTIQADRLSSIILWGPPGCGKTSLARVISNTTKYKFLKMNAVTSGIADIKNAVDTAQNVLLNPSGKCILFIDEIHRFNKLQQDALLPYVENGTIILIGATTENPYFEVNKALISRSMVFHLNPLTEANIFQVLKKSLTAEEGLGSYHVKIEDSTLQKIAMVSNGDVRTALNGLEVAVLTTQMDENGMIVITDEIVKECVQTRKAVFDKNGDSHYDNISAFIKSMRGSDVDAALFYLARALNAGEDPVFMARRIVIAAAEDVGMANPNALVVATSCMQAVMMVGMPEARIILAEATVYVATSKKSNAAYLGIDKALADVANKDTGTIPMHIRNAPAEGMAKEGYGVGYKYPHDYPGHFVEQQYLPDKMVGTKYYIQDDTVELVTPKKNTP